MPSNAEIIEAVTKWQSDDNLHPLTCGTDSNHQPLEAVEENNQVILKCKDCDYTQNFIPPVVAAFNGELKNTGPGQWN